MDPGIEYLQHLQHLLTREKEADYVAWQEQVTGMTLADRVRLGLSWHPVTVVKTGFTIGDKVQVTVQRAPASPNNSRLKAGAPATFYSLAAHAGNPRLNGVIHYATETRMQLILHVQDLPDWLTAGPLGVDLDFDIRTYQEMEKALTRALTARSGTLPKFREIFAGMRPAESFPVDGDAGAPESTLNHAQIAAVRGIEAAKDAFLVHGPPGTGKTTTLVAAIARLTKRENQVLVCAPSNTATDVLAERLDAAGLKVVRLGHISRVDEEVVRLTLDARVDAHPENREIKKIRIQAAEARRKAGRHRRSFDQQARSERKAGYAEAREWEEWARHLEDRLVDQILDSAQVIAATLTGASHPLLEKRRFQTLVVDEAAQALEPALWIPLDRVEKVILAGDPFQLPPTVKSADAARQGLSRTLMERLLPHFPFVQLLQIQYRMHPAIMAFSNHYFYGGQLQSAPALLEQPPDDSAFPPLLFIDTAGCGFDERLHPVSRSLSNPDEGVLITCHLESLLTHTHGYPPPEIMILSPYREQVEHLREVLLVNGTHAHLPLSVQTIDGFQGQETDIVILSLVRSNDRSEIGFLKDYRRMNVAMTRARRQLVVIGDSATIGQDPFYEAFLRHCQDTGAWRSAWEYVR